MQILPTVQTKAGARGDAPAIPPFGHLDGIDASEVERGRRSHESAPADASIAGSAGSFQGIRGEVEARGAHFCMVYHCDIRCGSIFHNSQWCRSEFRVRLC